MSNRSTVPKGFDQIHHILGTAMRACDAGLWPARPHLDGPLPAVSLVKQVAIAHDVCEQAQRIAADGERAEVAALGALAREVMRVGRKTFAKADKLHREQLDKASKPKKSDRVAVKVGKLTVRAAMNFLYASPSARNAIGLCIGNACAALVQALAENEARAFLARLDAAIVRAEIEDELFDRSIEPASPIVRVLSRPAAKTSKGFGLAFVELANGSFGLLVKLKGRWQWHEGDRATMFATVPDEYMEAVIEDIEPKKKLRDTLRRSRAG